MTLNKGTLGPMLLVSNFNHLQTALAVFYGFQGEACKKWGKYIRYQ